MEEEFNPQRFGVTPELFREWREPRFGNANPQKLTSKVWEWLVQSKLSGYGAAKADAWIVAAQGRPNLEL